jgi:hypothetical protein
VDGSVVGAWITAGAALVVAVGGSVRGDLRLAGDRRYERRRAALTEAQDAALALRTALAEYGSSLRTTTAEATAGGGGFVMAVPDRLDTEVSEAEGRLLVARSRVDDAAVVAALDTWRRLARVSLIDARDAEASSERKAFDEVNELIGAALRSGNARTAK